MPTNYLHPVLITLTDLNFNKVDVTAAGELSQALFAVDSFGTLHQPSITLDRVAGTVTYALGANKATTGTAAGGYGGTMTGQAGAASINEYSCSEVETNYPAVLTDGAGAGGASTDPDQILIGMVFCKMVHSIFSAPAGDTLADLTANLDVTSAAVRTNGLFFDGDGGTNLVTNVLAQTNGDSASNTGFTRVITHGNSDAESAEYDYWNVRTAHTPAAPNSTAESNTVAFANGDKIYIKYSLNGKFLAGASLDNHEDLSALAANATALASSPFINATVELSFILGWVVDGLA